MNKHEFLIDVLISNGKLLFEGIPSDKNENTIHVVTILKNFESLGFTLTPEFIGELVRCDVEYLTKFYNTSIPLLKKAVGAHRKFAPMYPNFPKQVMLASEAELFINAIMHYLGDAVGLRIMPKYKKINRGKLDIELKNLKVLDIGTIDDVKKIIVNLITSKTSISDSDKDKIFTYISNYKDIDLANVEIHHKEIMAEIVKMMLNFKYDTKQIISIPKTVVDIIRISVSMSGGDVTLSKNSKFTKFKRKERRLILSMFDSLKYVDQDNLFTYNGKLKRLGEILHPGEYKKQYPQAFMVFHTVRKDSATSSIGEIDKAVIKDNIVGAVKLLVKKPGVFARRLDHLLRISSSAEKDAVLKGFESIAKSISTPVLLQISNHFNNRSLDRVVMTKSKNPKIFVLDPVPEIRKTYLDQVSSIITYALYHKFSTLPDMGNTYIDPELKNYLVPLSQRSASKTLKTVARGSRIPLGKKPKHIRLFTWWKQSENDRVDIDLSAVFFDSKFVMTDNISFRNLRNEYSVHSGDITSAPNGACEFIDINIDDIPDKIKYVAIVIYNYTETSFVTLPECFAGVMYRDNAQKGEVFDARTVDNKLDIASDSKGCMPLIYDVENNEIIWADTPLDQKCLGAVYESKGIISNVCKGLVSMKKMNLHEFFTLHATVRGCIVDDKSKAKTVLSIENGTQYKLDEIASQYIA